MIKIAYDLDECLFDSYELWKKIVERDGYKPLPHEHFRIKTDPEMDDKTIMKYFSKVFLRWHDIEPCDGAVELVKRQYEVTGEPIYIITNRPEHFATETIKLIRRLGVPFKLTMTENSDTKWKYLKGYDYFVEDRRRTARICAAMGYKVLMPEKQYNDLGIKTPPKSDSDRAFSHLLNRCTSLRITPISGIWEVHTFFDNLPVAP